MGSLSVLPNAECDGTLLTEACSTMKRSKVIENAVKCDGLMDTDSLQLAIKKMRTEDPCGNATNGFCKHYFNPLYAIKSEDGAYMSLKMAIENIIAEEECIQKSKEKGKLIDCQFCQVLCIPVIHGQQIMDGKSYNGGHWTLYAFHLNSRKVSILDSLMIKTTVPDHDNLSRLIFNTLDNCERFKNKSSDKHCEVHSVLESPPQQQNGNDCGFYVFNFMRRWDGDKLDKWKPPSSTELRNEFRKYILTPDGLEHIKIHHSDPADEKEPANSECNQQLSSQIHGPCRGCTAMVKYNVIKKAVKSGGCMDIDSLQLAIKKMRTDDPCGNPNYLCCKHYFNPLDAVKLLNGNSMSDINVDDEEINASPCHNTECQVLCIPVIHGEYWTLYAFHLSSRRVSILESRSSGKSKAEHQSLSRLIFESIDKHDRFKDKSSDKSWEIKTVEFAHQQPNRDDCGFYVFNFMRCWNGVKLDKSWKPPESENLREEFKKYILSTDDLKHILIQHSDQEKSASSSLDELYKYTTGYSTLKEEVWVSSTYPTQISLDVNSIQNLLNSSGCMDTKSLNLAIRKMVIMESNDGNLDNTNHLSCKHYVSTDFARYAISKEDEDTNMETCILHDFMNHHSASNPQVLCIPVIHEGRWILYAFNMADEKVSILDPSLNMAVEKESTVDPSPNVVDKKLHILDTSLNKDDKKGSILDQSINHKHYKSIRLKICKALERAKAKSYLFKSKSGNFSCWKYEFVEVKHNEKSCDSGFIVFNYMLWWDGSKLDESKFPNDANLRKEFLAYILCFKDNQAYQQPYDLYQMIKTLPSAPAWGRCLMENEFLKVLIEENVMPKVTDKEFLFRGTTTDGEGVLHIGARIGNMDLVTAIFGKFEVENLLEPQRESTVNNDKDNPKITENNDKDFAIDIDVLGKEKIIQFADFLVTRNYRGETCLHEAIRWDRKEIVTSLILVDEKMCKDDRTRPSLVKIVDYGGVSPLYLATMLERFDIVLSLTKKCDVHNVKVDGHNILAASYAGPGGQTALHAAILLKNRKLIKQLVEWNKDLISEQDKRGRTPLHLLALVEEGLDDVTDILQASHASHKHSNGPCDFLKKDSNGMLPIHVAASNGRLEIIKRLLKACHHCMCSRNASGKSFLHVAVEQKRIGVVRHVCNDTTLYAILNLQDQDGNTALHLAVKSGYQPIFFVLMSNPGVSLSLANKEGLTPRDIATLGINYQLKLVQNSRVLISWHLGLARAKFGACRKDEQYMAAKLDKEDLSDKMTKFAGPMAVCAIFMLNISVAAFFSIAKSYLPSAESNAPPAPMAMTTSKSNAARFFKALVIIDIIAFSSSALAAFSSTLATLSVMDRPTRLLYLRTGGIALQIASIAMVAVFVLAVYLAFGPVDSIFPTLAGVLGLVAVSPQFTPLFFIILHAWTLLYRSMLFHKTKKIQTILRQLPPIVGNVSLSVCKKVVQLLASVFYILGICVLVLVCCIPVLIICGLVILLFSKT